MNRAYRAHVATVLVLVATTTLHTGVASAHGLVQVDVLSHQDVFVPPWAVGGFYGADPRLSKELDKGLRHLRAAGRPTKVALLAQRVDLGDAGQYFKRPVAYAAFLDQLLVNLRIFDGRLVIVMPNGSADIVAGKGARSLGLVPAMKTKWDVNALLRTAIEAVDARPGVDIAAPGHAGGARDWWLILTGGAFAGGILAGVAMLVARLILNRRQQRVRPTRAQ